MPIHKHLCSICLHMCKEFMYMPLVLWRNLAISSTKQLIFTQKVSQFFKTSSLLIQIYPDEIKKFLVIWCICTSIKSALLSSTRVKSHFHCGKSDVLSKKHFETFLSFAPLAAAQLKKSMPNDYAQECLRSLYACIMQAHLYYNHWVLY